MGNTKRIDITDATAVMEGMRDGPVAVAGMEFWPSRIIRELDAIAYREGLLCYVDGIDVESDPAYQELQEQLQELQDELCALESGEDSDLP